jgi:hypothetical protein
MLDDPMLATQLAEQAARDCDDWFEPIAIAQRTLDFYSKVIERHAR